MELLRRKREERQRQEQRPGEQAVRAGTMTCPRCGGPMRERVIGNVTIDRCERCEGVFLDKGELERLTGGGLFASLRKLF